MKVPFPYREVDGYLWLPLEKALFAKLPETVTTRGMALYRKKEFHVTLAYFQALLSDAGMSDSKESLLREFSEFVAMHPVIFRTFRDDMRFASREKKRSVVVRCEVSNVEELFQKWETILGIKLDRQPTHVTVYTLQPEIGIGINTMEEMEALPRVDVPEIRNALGLA